MIKFLIIYIIGFLWLTRDILRVPENFNDSYFKIFKGNQFIDPQISWSNKNVFGELIGIFLAPFADLFHLLGTIILFLYFYLIYKGIHSKITWPKEQPKWVFFIIAFMMHGLGAWTAYGIWRQLLN